MVPNIYNVITVIILWRGLFDTKGWEERTSGCATGVNQILNQEEEEREKCDAWSVIRAFLWCIRPQYKDEFPSHRDLRQFLWNARCKGICCSDSLEMSFSEVFDHINSRVE